MELAMQNVVNVAGYSAVKPKFAQCDLCESNSNGFLLVPYAVFLDLDYCARAPY